MAKTNLIDKKLIPQNMIAQNILDVHSIIKIYCTVKPVLLMGVTIQSNLSYPRG